MKWFRFYAEALHDGKVQRLSAQLFRHWINVLCLANEGKPRGRLPEMRDIAYGLHLTPTRAATAIKSLQECGLLDEIDGRLVPHNWDERQPAWDDPKERQRRHRSRDDDVAWSRDNRVLEEKRVEETRTEESRPEAEGLLPLLIDRYENEIGSLTPVMEPEMREWAERIPDERFISYAFKEASANGARNWKYVETIFTRLEAEGWPADLGVVDSASVLDSVVQRHMAAQAVKARERDEASP